MQSAIHPYIEYTLLNPLVTDTQIDAAAQLAVQLQLGALCVPPYWVKKASRETAGTSVQLTTVIGYPFGFQRTEAKIAEMELAFADGAQSIELMINLSAWKSNRMNWVKAEIARFAHLVHAREATFTVMTDGFRIGQAHEEEVFCKLCADAGADYVCLYPAFVSVSVPYSAIIHLRNLLPESVGIKTWVEEDELTYVKFIDAGTDLLCVPSVAFLEKTS
ncbi:2-deoxyribose-5-phosphate aldolase [Rhodocytophaga rosea]|uniref:2-deoxyribose-5-phosphate aldolase n=1 Tax=Rhodocytophaga rosea TaxID=2704465 RepID=A0A6C0GK42_9BACT|nr:2-deoxyribose-5-phosphate aldolase [Rhodocytophaga rosea]QHT68398.1 2-deoxyribose-5-phosphate aldolase [Rhodocytophaga rosea]